MPLPGSYIGITGLPTARCRKQVPPSPCGRTSPSSDRFDVGTGCAASCCPVRPAHMFSRVLRCQARCASRMGRSAPYVGPSATAGGLGAVQVIAPLAAYDRTTGGIGVCGRARRTGVIWPFTRLPSNDLDDFSAICTEKSSRSLVITPSQWLVRLLVPERPEPSGCRVPRHDRHQPEQPGPAQPGQWRMRAGPARRSARLSPRRLSRAERASSVLRAAAERDDPPGSPRPYRPKRKSRQHRADTRS